MTLTRLHLLPDDERSNARVSPLSRWRDHKWHLAHDKIGLPKSAGMFNWALDMGDGSTLLDIQWDDLLEQTRKLVWSLLTDARSGLTLDPVTIAGSFHVQLGKLLRWMGANSYVAFAELDADASWEYHDHTLGILREEKDGNVASGRFQYDLQILRTIYRQSTALEDAGVTPMPEAPYDALSPISVAIASSTKENGWIEPLPDEVAMSVLAACIRWMGTPMNDILELRDLYLNLSKDISLKAGPRPVETILSSFNFSVIAGDEKPWHDRLGTEPGISLVSEDRFTRLDSELRVLIAHASSACVSLIQGTTAMRISEISALRAGVDEATGLPKYITVERSKTGLNELFFLDAYSGQRDQSFWPIVTAAHEMVLRG